MIVDYMKNGICCDKINYSYLGIYESIINRADKENDFIIWG